jgi:hypothetical protein
VDNRAPYSERRSAKAAAREELSAERRAGHWADPDDEPDDDAATGLGPDGGVEGGADDA